MHSKSAPEDGTVTFFFHWHIKQWKWFFFRSKVEHLVWVTTVKSLFHVLHPVFLHCSIDDGQPHSTVSFRHSEWNSKFPFFCGIFFSEEGKWNSLKKKCPAHSCETNVWFWGCSWAGVGGDEGTHPAHEPRWQKAQGPLFCVFWVTQVPQTLLKQPLFEGEKYLFALTLPNYEVGIDACGRKIKVSSSLLRNSDLS